MSKVCAGTVKTKNRKSAIHTGMLRVLEQTAEKGKTMNEVKKLARLLRDLDAYSHSTSFEEQAEFLIANGVTVATDNNVGGKLSTIREATVRMAERWEEAVVCEIVKEARLAGFTEVTVLNKEVILEALRRYTMPPKTNADKIRAMTDEELAVVIMCPWGTEPDLCCTKGTCLDCCLEWLKQPAEDDC